MFKVLVIVGPTAVGKTNISIKLAQKFNGEIINGDSVQVYRGLDIGSAKIKTEEMKGIKHHLLDIKDPDESFSVAEYQKLVRDKITEISKKGKLPIIVGGTGLYIQAVLYDFQFIEEGDFNNLAEKYRHLSNEELHLLLKEIDELESMKIHVNNRRRIIRALEIYEKQNITKSEIIKSQDKGLLYDAFIIGLTMDRRLLYERINKRVDMMFEENLLEEAQNLYHKGYIVNAIGYKEFTNYFRGEITLQEVKEKIKKNTRNYAKRQLTYFRNKLPVNWVDVNKTSFESIYQDVLNWIS